MSEPRRSMWPIVAVLMLLPVLYVASIGPVVWMDNRGHIPEWSRGPLEALYAPLEWVLSKSQTLDHWFERYVDLWW